MKFTLQKNEAVYCLKSNTSKVVICQRRSSAARILGVSKKKLKCLIKPNVISSQKVELFNN